MTLSVSDSYFLTRQTANIIEDLRKRLTLNDSVSLLHGKQGVGKTRLLQQLVDGRSLPGNPLFFRFSHSGVFHFQGEELSIELFSDKVIQELVNVNTNNLILDQFDQIGPEAQRMILQWYLDMSKKAALNLVITLETVNLTAFYRLAVQTGISIEAVELQPLSYRERLQYLSRIYCETPSRTIMETGKLKRLLQQNEGGFYQLQNIMQRYGKEIVCCQKENHRRLEFESRVMGVLLLACLAIFAIYWLLFDQWYKPAGFSDTLQSQPDPGKPAVQNYLAKNTQVTITKPDMQDRVNETGSPVETPSESGYTVSARVKRLSETGKELKTSQTETNEVAVNVSAQKQQGLIHGDNIEPETFRQGLKAGQHWIRNATEKSASIQIMTVIYQKERSQLMRDYFNRLKSASVDLDQIKIFPLNNSKKKLYAIFYGEYDSFTEASRALKQLPEILQANRPYCRTAKAIRNDLALNQG